MTQTQQILSHLKRGRTLTHLNALSLFDSARLAARIWDLKCEGHPIVSEKVRLSSGKIISRYYLMDTKKPQVSA